MSVLVLAATQSPYSTRTMNNIVGGGAIFSVVQLLWYPVAGKRPPAYRFLVKLTLCVASLQGVFAWTFLTVFCATTLGLTEVH